MKKYVFALSLAVILIFVLSFAYFKFIAKTDKYSESGEKFSSETESKDENDDSLGEEKKYYKITYSSSGDWLKSEESYACDEYFYLMPAIRAGYDFLYYTDEDGNIYYADETHAYILTKDVVLTPVFE